MAWERWEGKHLEYLLCSLSKGTLFAEGVILCPHTLFSLGLKQKFDEVTLDPFSSTQSNASLTEPVTKLSFKKPHAPKTYLKEEGCPEESQLFGCIEETKGTNDLMWK